MDKVRTFVKFFIGFFIPLLMLNGVIYFGGLLITGIPNPFDWLLFSTTIGKAIYMFLNALIIINSETFWDNLNY